MNKISQTKINYLLSVGYSKELIDYAIDELEVHSKMLVWVCKELKKFKVSGKELGSVTYMVHNSSLSLKEAIRYIADWFLATRNTDLSRYSISVPKSDDMDEYFSALYESEIWHENLTLNSDKAYENAVDKNVVYTAGKYSIVKITTKHDLKVEGERMGHCVGSGGYDNYARSKTNHIYSLRDEHNNPHATMEVKGNKIYQIKGKRDRSPVDRYWGYILDFIKDSKFDIRECNDINNSPTRVLTKEGFKTRYFFRIKTDEEIKAEKELKEKGGCNRDITEKDSRGIPEPLQQNRPCAPCEPGEVGEVKICESDNKNREVEE